MPRASGRITYMALPLHIWLEPPTAKAIWGKIGEDYSSPFQNPGLTLANITTGLEPQAKSPHASAMAVPMWSPVACADRRPSRRSPTGFKQGRL